MSTGISPVPKSCQIPNLRALYAELGLSPNRGTFVEVGAYDGETHSNTSFLADQGWRGLYIEPIEAFCAAARFRHALNTVTVEPLAVSDLEGSAQIEQMGPLTTLNTAWKDGYPSIPWARAATEVAVPVQVKTARLAPVLERNQIPDTFELMVVDVEGFEETIIAQLLESRWRPKVLVVELIDHHPDFQKLPHLVDASKRCRRQLTDGGFVERYKDQINTVFCAV